MSAQPQPQLTPEQYLELDRASQFRNEYYNGHMYAMSGGTYAHGKIIANLGRQLGNALDPGPCTVTSSDVRVQVELRGLYCYPDVVVVCGDPQYHDNRLDTILNPTLLIEVLSPSTEAYDRGFKSAQYRTVESLQEYALVSQAEPRVEIFRREGNGEWVFSEFVGLDATARFRSVECTIPLGKIYSKVAFNEDAAPPQTT